MTLTEQIGLWYQAGEHERTVSAIMKLPASQRTDDLMGELAVAYNNLGQYAMALLVLEELKPRTRFTWRWQYRMGYALYYSAMKAADSQRTIRLLSQAEEAFSDGIKLNPPEHIKNDCLEFLEWIRQDLEAADPNQAPVSP